jgi:hypothetical protein
MKLNDVFTRFAVTAAPEETNGPRWLPHDGFVGLWDVKKLT